MSPREKRQRQRKRRANDRIIRLLTAEMRSRDRQLGTAGRSDGVLPEVIEELRGQYR